jgi:hypothetical protein
MNKKNSLALCTLFIVGLFSLFTANILAQANDSLKTEQKTKPCSGEKFVMPQTISLDNEAFEDYLKTVSLSRDERRKTFSKLSNEQKASFVKIQFALQLVKRPNLTKQQRDFIFELMSKVSADLYDRENPQKVALAEMLNQETEAKAFGLFAQKDAFEILEGLGASKDEDVALLQKYQDLLKSGTLFRKKLVNEMSITERAAIWKTQLAYHLATSSLNREQKEFIVEIMPNIQSIFESFANLSEEEKTKYTETIESSMFKVFTKAEAYAVFMTIGIQNKIVDDSEFLDQFGLKRFGIGYLSQNRVQPQIVRINFSNTSSLGQVGKNKLPQFLTALSVNAPICACRWYCEYGSCGDAYCHRTSSGCGVFDTSECTNRCV